MADSMYELTRTVRFCVRPAGDSAIGDAPTPAGHSQRHNTFAAWPTMHGLGAFYELRIACRGRPDAETGYLMSIGVIDEHVRSIAIPLIERAFRDRPDVEPGIVLAEVFTPLCDAIGPALHSIRWQLTPYYAVAMTTASPNRVLISQQFEFAASHRLHCPSLSEEANREVFGKCNNDSGHGHNYRIEPVVSVPLEAGSDVLNLMTLERLVHEHIIQRFDHKHLNLDTEEFATLNPSVEHIAKVCYDRLAHPIASHGGRLERITVWETEKTSCTYPAPGDG
jgi:6-pyruvoyltetrahydropterin/6-carboxytetrahydropterin synthase